MKKTNNFFLKGPNALFPADAHIPNVNISHSALYFTRLTRYFFQLAEDEKTQRKRRAEESLKARQEEVEKEKAERTREINSERQKHRHDEAVQHFKALLVDMVCCDWSYKAHAHLI